MKQKTKKTEYIGLRISSELAEKLATLRTSYAKGINLTLTQVVECLLNEAITARGQNAN
jgi:hypothetical protein